MSQEISLISDNIIKYILYTIVVKAHVLFNLDLDELGNSEVRDFGQA